MSDRVPAAIAAVSSIAILIYACATAPTTNNPAPATPVTLPAPISTGTLGQTVQRGPLTDSARRVRDSLTAARRDSGAAMVLRSIAGRENQPAESVFKNIKILRAFQPAGSSTS